MTDRVFRRYTDKTSQLSAIDNVKYPGGEYNVLSILTIFTQVFSPLKGDRPDVQNIGILISTEPPYYPAVANGAASLLVQLNGVGVFVVCVEPGCDEDFPKAIASPPKKVRYTINVKFRLRP